MKSKINVFRLVVLVIVVSLFSWYAVNNKYSLIGNINTGFNKIEGKTLNDKFDTKIKSGNLSTDYTVPQALNDIEEFDLNTVNVPIVININDRTSDDMSVDKDSKDKAIYLIKKLKGKKINVILEAYPWIENGEVGETKWIPKDINIFFENWKHNVLSVLINDVALPYHVDVMSIGTSFDEHIESEQEKMCDLVDYVKEYYKGLVTYRTNFWVTAGFEPELEIKYEKKISNPVFSKLDFISIASYFELTGNETNTVENLVSALHSTQINDRKQNVVKEMENLHDKWNKPIFFGELGFPRTNKASVAPYDPSVSNVSNGVEQANCFKAYKEVFEDCPWNLGFSIFAIGEKSKDKMYYPSSESSEVIKNWYEGN